MKLSVITVTKNNRLALEKTLELVLLQKTDDFEVVVVDGASTDGTVPFLQSLKDPRLRLVSEKDRGIYNAMNKGIDLARGEYLYFLNAGDRLYSSDSISQLITHLYGNDVFYCDIIMDFKGKSSIARQYPDKLDHQFWLFAQICHQAVIYKRALLEKLGGYDETIRYAADFELTLRCWKEPGVQFRHIHQTLAIYDMHGMTADTKNNARVAKEYFEIQKRLIPALHFWPYLAFKAINENKIFMSSPSFQFVRRILIGTARRFYKKVKIKDDFKEATE